MNETKNSLKDIFKERLTSPLYGTFIFSWIISNWKIFYLTFFIESNEIPGNKINYIVSNYSNWKNLLLYPLIYTIAFILILPVLNNLVFKLFATYKKRRKDISYNINKDVRLTVTESIEIREQYREMNNRFISTQEEKEKKLVELLEEVNNLQESVGDLNEYSSQLNQENKKQSQKLQDLEIILKRYRNLHKEIQIDVNDISKEMGDGVLVEYKKIDSIIEDMIRSFEQFNENF